MKTRVAVIGGGAIGASIAWRLARRGASVVVIDDARAGAATPAAGGMLAPLAEAHRPGPFLDLGLESLRRWPAFVAELEAETGIEVGYARAGKLIVALTPAEEDDLAATYGERVGAPDAQLERLDGDVARALEPALAPQVRAVVLIRDDHRVDNVALGTALARAARLAGAQWLRATVRAVLSSAGRVTAVETTERGSIAADFVVVCAGAWSGGIEGLPRELPVRPVRGQMLALRPARPLFGRTLAGAQCYLVPRADGRVVIGSTMEEAGWNATTTPAALAELRAAAIRLVPALAHAARVSAWAGLRPATADDMPVIGPDPALPSLFYATGHFRNGILLAPVTADAISAGILSGSDYDVSPWSPARLEAGSAVRAPAVRTMAAPGRSGHRAGVGPADEDRTCDLCGAEMYAVHCKLICPACGYGRDCSDLW